MIKHTSQGLEVDLSQDKEVLSIIFSELCRLDVLPIMYRASDTILVLKIFGNPALGYWELSYPTVEVIADTIKDKIAILQPLEKPEYLPKWHSHILSPQDLNDIEEYHVQNRRYKEQQKRIENQNN